MFRKKAKPCRCGRCESRAVVAERDGKFYVRCRKCRNKALAFFGDRESAVEYWNGLNRKAREAL